VGGIEGFQEIIGFAWNVDLEDISLIQIRKSFELILIQIGDITLKMVQNDEKKSFTADEATRREFSRRWGF